MKQIANKQLLRVYGKVYTDRLNLTVENIRTSSFDEKTGKYECAADLKATGDLSSKSIPIRYTSELIDDKDGFYVQVYGL